MTKVLRPMVEPETSGGSGRLYPTVLGAAWQDLPEPVRVLHTLRAGGSASGRADVEGATRPVARLVAHLFGLPGSAQGMPVRVTFAARGIREVWTRDFAGRRFASIQEPAGSPGRLVERFGP